MLTGPGRAGRGHGGRDRFSRLAIPLAIPIALGVILAIVVMVSGGGPTASNQVADGASASPSAQASSAPSGPAPRGPPPPPARGPAAATTTTTDTTNVNCDIIVPANPLTAKGLATPYQLTGPDGMSAEQSGCTMTNAANLGAFVQATILNTQ